MDPSATMDVQQFTASGGVSGIVANMQSLTQGAGARDSTARHGLAEQSSIPRSRRDRPRNRDRNPQPHMPRSNTRDFRAEARAFREHAEAIQAARALGPKTRTGFHLIVDGINDRLDTLERFQQLHAQSIAFCDQSVTGNRNAIKMISQDFEKYKQFITITHGFIDRFVNDKHREIIASVEGLAAQLAPRVERLDQRMMVLEAHLQDKEFGNRRPPTSNMTHPETSGVHQLPPPALPSSQAANARPEDFQIGTEARNVGYMSAEPPAEAPAPPDYAVADPWFQAAQRLQANHQVS